MKSTAALFKLKRIRIFHRSLRRKVDPNVSSRLNTSKTSATGSAEIDEVSDGGLIEIYTLSHLFWNASWPIQYFTIERTNDTMTSHRKMTASVAKLSSKIAFFFPKFFIFVAIFSNISANLNKIRFRFHVLTVDPVKVITINGTRHRFNALKVDSVKVIVLRSKVMGKLQLFSDIFN